MKYNDLYIAKDVEVHLKENQILLVEHDGEILTEFKVLTEDDILKKVDEFHKTGSLTLAREIVDALYRLYN